MPTPKPRRPVSLPPVCGFQIEVEASDRDRLTLASTQQCLAALRTGEASAEGQLIRGHRWLVYELASSEKSPYGYRFEWLAPLYDGLVTAVRRLKENAETDVEPYIRKELTRSTKRYRREISENVLPKPSTNSYRRKRGLPEYPTIKRLHEVRKNLPRGRKEVYLDPLDDHESVARTCASIASIGRSATGSRRTRNWPASSMSARRRWKRRFSRFSEPDSRSGTSKHQLDSTPPSSEDH